MRSPLTETIKRVEGMIAYVRENLDEGEYDLFLDLILPEPEPVKAAKKGRKKSAKGGSKSARAQSLSGVIQRTPKSKTDDDNDDDSDGKGMGGSLCQTCGNFRQYQDHFKPSPDYHEFDAGKSSAAATAAGD